MATFNVGIGKDDVQGAILLPEDFYTMEISKDPAEAKNKAWTDAGETLSLEEAHAVDEKAGKNIVLQLKIVSEIPEESGRTFTKWLSLPNKYDEGQYMNNGQPKADWKAEAIHKWADAFGSGSDGAEVTFNKGSKALVYLVVGKDRNSGEEINEISMNVDPRRIGDPGGHAPSTDVFDETLL